MALRATGFGVEVIQQGHLVRGSALGVEVVAGPALPPGVRASTLGVEVAVQALLTPFRPTVSVVTRSDVDATFASSPFQHGREGASHVATYWEVDTSGGDFSSPVASNAGEEGSPATLTGWIATGLTAGASYIVRARYEDEEGGLSPWSASAAFVTLSSADQGDLPNTPTVTLEGWAFGDAIGDFDSLIRASFQLSAFFSPVGATHNRTEWQLIRDPGNAVNWGAFNLLDTRVQTFAGTRWDPAPALEQGMRYRVRARVRDSNGNFSPWSTPLVYDTEEVIAPPIITAPRAGEPLAAAKLVEWVERKRTGEEAATYSYRAEYTANDGGAWTPLFSGLAADEYAWSLTGLADGLGYMIRIRTEYEGDVSSWHYSPPFVIDNAEELVTVWEPTPGDVGIGSWTRGGDLAQTWTQQGTLIRREGPPVNSQGDGRGSGFSVLGYPVDTEPLELEITAGFRFRGNGINGNDGPSGANRFLPLEFTRAGVGTGTDGTWTSTTPGQPVGTPPSGVSGIAAVLNPNTIWGISDPGTLGFGGNQFGRSNDARLELVLPMSYSTTPGGSLVRSTIRRTYAAREMVHWPTLPFVSGDPGQWMAIRLRVTVLAVNGDDSAHPGRYTLRLRASYHAPYGRAGQAPGWALDRTLYNCDLDCGLAGLAGWTVAERLSNDNVARAEYRDLSIAVLSTCEEPPTPCADGFDVTFFDDGGLVPLVGSADSGGFVAEASYYTGRNCPRPWMKVPDRWGDVQVDFLAGSSDTGAMDVEVVDKRTDPEDQRTGHITANIAGRCVNRRAVVRRFREDLGVHVVVLDGICTGYTIEAGSVATYRFHLRDTRDRERVPLFERNETLSIFPARGPVLGYGRNDFGGTGTVSYLLPPAASFVGNYVANSPTDGSLQTSVRSGLLGGALFAGFPVAEFAGDGATYPEVAIRWRSTLITAPEVGWTYLRNMPAPGDWTVWNAFGTIAEMAEVAAFFTEDVTRQFVAAGNNFAAQLAIDFSPLVRLYFSSANPAALPGDGQLIEVQVLHAGEPTETLPLYYDGTFGDLLRRVWDGAYNIEDPRIRYDEDRLSFLSTSTPPARMIVTERVDSMKDWLASNVFAPIGFVPRFDVRGLLYPVPDTVPPVAFLPVIDEDNAIFEGSGWDHGADNAVHEVDFTYLREFVVTSGGETFLSSQPIRSRIVSPVAREVIADPVEYRPVTVRSTGSGGGAVLGNVAAEIGSVLARQRADALLTRYRFGAPVLRLSVRSSDPTAAALLPGDWVRVTLSWLPEYATGIRGVDRVMQVTGAVDEDVATRTLTLTDGYAVDDAPSSPIFGSITFDGAGRALIPITAVPSGGTVRVEYSVTQLQPEEDSALWLLGGVLAAPGTVTTTVVPPGGIVWARARSTTADGQPSAWVVAAAVQAGVAPFIFSVTVAPSGSGYAVAWVVTPQTLGVRVEWGVHDPLVPVTYTDTADTIATGSLLLPVVLSVGERLTVRVTPWSGFAAGAVDGAPGTPTVASYTFVDSDQALLSSAGAVRSGAGTCPDGIPLTVSWAGGGTNYSTNYTVSILRFVAAAEPFYFEDWAVVASGLTPSAGSYADTFAGRTHDEAAGSFTSIVYRVRLTHTPSGLVVSEREAPALGVYAVECL